MTNRDYYNLDLHYQELLGDVYSQPIDDGHLNLMREIITKWLAPFGGGTVLDVGSGYGEAGKIFRNRGFTYFGVSMAEHSIQGEDYIESGDFDFNFLLDSKFDFIFSRHSLEHSPFPILTLMEWHRVSNKWLALVVPNPEHYKYVGRNHYSVANIHQNIWWLRRAGWKLNKLNVTKTEFWFLCEKKPRISYEGWAKAPIHHLLYEFERDLKDFEGEMDVTKYFADRKWDELF